MSKAKINRKVFDFSSREWLGFNLYVASLINSTYKQIQ